MTTLRWTIAFLVFSSVPLPAQTVQRLPRADHVLRGEFTRISAMRELSDSLILLTDSREKRLVHGNWKTLAVRQIGRVGDGPGEYRAPSRLVALGPDSTVLVDTQARRWITYFRDQLASQMPVEQSLRLANLEPPIRGVDTRGRILHSIALQSGARSVPRRAFDSDSLVLVLSHIDAVHVDTVARLRGRGSRRGSITRGDAGGATQYSLYGPLSIEEQAWLFRDGWIAIAWLDPYRVDWIKPDGTRVRGEPLERLAKAVTTAEMKFAIEREWSWLAPPPPGPEEFPEWPASMPAFVNDALVPLPDGRLAIQRMPSTGARLPVYDIIDRNGRRVARLELPAGHRIIGFGSRHVYVVSKDELDVERVSRHSFEVPAR
jgi:hypothetical protein